jgi:hypothetical protein
LWVKRALATYLDLAEVKAGRPMPGYGKAVLEELALARGKKASGARWN